MSLNQNGRAKELSNVVSLYMQTEVYVKNFFLKQACNLPLLTNGDSVCCLLFLKKKDCVCICIKSMCICVIDIRIFFDIKFTHSKNIFFYTCARVPCRMIHTHVVLVWVLSIAYVIIAGHLVTFKNILNQNKIYLVQVLKP